MTNNERTRRTSGASEGKAAPGRVVPLSGRNRRRVLKGLADAAAGDHQAARALLEVGAAIDRLKAEAEAEDGV